MRTFLRPSREATGATVFLETRATGAFTATAEPRKVEVMAAILIGWVCVNETRVQLGSDATLQSRVDFPLDFLFLIGQFRAGVPPNDELLDLSEKLPLLAFVRETLLGWGEEDGSSFAERETPPGTTLFALDASRGTELGAHTHALARSSNSVESPHLWNVGTRHTGHIREFRNYVSETNPRTTRGVCPGTYRVCPRT